MQNALKASQHPSIEYAFQHLQQAALQWNPPNHQARLKLNVIGKLKMAGVERPITMEVIVWRDSRGNVVAHSQAALLMTDFGVTPPGALFGLIKANDHVLLFLISTLFSRIYQPPRGHSAQARQYDEPLTLV